MTCLAGVLHFHKLMMIKCTNLNDLLTLLVNVFYLLLTLMAFYIKSKSSIYDNKSRVGILKFC